MNITDLVKEHLSKFLDCSKEELVIEITDNDVELFKNELLGKGCTFKHESKSKHHETFVELCTYYDSVFVVAYVCDNNTIEYLYIALKDKLIPYYSVKDSNKARNILNHILNVEENSMTDVSKAETPADITIHKYTEKFGYSSDKSALSHLARIYGEKTKEEFAELIEIDFM